MKYIAAIFFLLVLFTLNACETDSPRIVRDLGAQYPESSLKGWELDETNTGLRGDTDSLEVLNPADVGRLENNTLIVTIPNATISHKRIEHQLLIQSSGVIIDHCLIKPLVCGRGVPVVKAGDATVRDTEIDCSAIPIEQVGFSIAITGMDCIIERCNIHGASTGISIHNRSRKRYSVAQGNYVHGLRLYIDPVTKEPAHIDGLTIRVSSGAGIIVRNNYINVEEQATGPLFIQAWAGYINNVLVQGNLLQGYGHCLELDYNAKGYGNNMQAIDNRLDAWTKQGAGPWYAALSGGKGWYLWTGNYAYDETADDCRGDAVSEP